jgi:hypothetical protein
MEGVLAVAALQGWKTNQAEGAAGVMAIETKQDAGFNAPLAGSAALDLYLAELARSVTVITRQSTLLVQALTEHAELLEELQRAAGPATDDIPPE